MFGRSPLSADSRPWYLGAIGELQVAKLLATLGPDWTVVHSVPIGDRGSDIDHVVVGDAGVFSINTKFHEDARIWVGSRRLLVNGQKTDHLRNSRFEAQRVSRKLTAIVGSPVDVHPMIVLVGARSITIRERPADMTVLRHTELIRWLTRRPTTVAPAVRDRLSEILTSRETWSAPVGHSSDVDMDVRAFASLRHEVVAAHRRRMLWATTSLVGAVGVTAILCSNAYATLIGG